MKYSSILARLVANTHEPENEQSCWVWKSKFVCHNGYGRLGLSLQGRPKLMAHRASWLLFEIGCDSTYEDLLIANINFTCSGLELNHLCCNRLCINPDHFEIVTPKENARYREAMKKRFRN